MKVPAAMSTIAFILQQKGITIASRYDGISKTDGWEHRAYTVALTGPNYAFSTKYSRGMAHARKEVSPDDIIPCLLTDARCFNDAIGVEEFAADLGYDMDTRESREKAKKAYCACGQAAARLDSIAFTAEELAAIENYIEENGL